MDIQNFQQYALLTIVIAFFVWRFFKFKKIKKQIPELLSQGATIIDVRSSTEFAQGSNARSINIPLGELDSKSKQLDKNKPVILCCASGTRSGAAVGILKKNGFKNVVNAGPWTNTMG